MTDASFDRAGIEQHQGGLNDPIDDLELRLTSRLLNHLKAAITHGVKHVNHDYPGSVNIERIGSVEKRVSGAVWSVLRQHPDVRHQVGKFEDELRQQLVTSEAECAKRSVMIVELRAEVAALRQERDAIQRRAEAAEADWQQAVQQLTTLRTALQMQPHNK